MKTMMSLGGSLSVAALALASSLAHAGNIDANLGVASEYVFRGVSQTNGNAAVSGGLDWSQDMYYAGTWLSSVDDGTGNAGTEVDIYGGVNVGNFDLGAIAYIFPADTEVRNSKVLELYAGTTYGPFTGYAFYGIDSYESTKDDYLYLNGEVSVPVQEGAELALGLGYWIGVGDDYDNVDEQVDLALTLKVGGFWAGVTTILENDSNAGAQRRPRVNVGYTWNFDGVLDLKFRSM